MDYRKLCSCSCCMDDGKLWEYTILGDLLEFDLYTKQICLIKGTEKYREIPSVFAIYKINNDIYYFDTDVNAIMDEEGNPSLVLEESENAISFFYCSQKYHNLLYLLEGTGRFYKRINITEKNYQYEKIAEPIIYACSFTDEMIWITSNGNVVSYSYADDSKTTIIKSELMIDIIAVTKDRKGKYYFLYKSGQIYIYDQAKKRLFLQYDLLEKGDTYSRIHVVNDKIILLPKKYSTQVKTIHNGHTNIEPHYEEYPADAIFFTEQPIMFNRYTEDKDYLIYPTRGLNYFLKISKKSGEIEWMKPDNVLEIMLNVSDKIKKSRNILRDGTISLEDFIEGISHM